MSTTNESNNKPVTISKKQSREESRQAAKSFIESLQAKPFPASERIYLTGSDDSIRVPMRKINLTDTPIGSDPDNLTFEPNEAIYVYDCSGPYADPQEHIDVYRGLAPMRASWIEKRGDTEVLPSVSSE
ncbi:MAG: phosphomethylpyrimidine synthase ThiC, partial [Marinomonas sp.]